MNKKKNTAKSPSASPGVVSAKLAEAWSQLSAGQLSGAESLARDVLRQAPKNADAHRLLGLAAHFSGRSADAERLLRTSVSLNPKSAMTWDNLCAVCLDTGRGKEALEAAQSSLALAPNNAATCFNLGRAYSMLGQHANAAGAFRRSLELKAGDFDALLGLADALRGDGKHADAIAIYQKLLDAKPVHLAASVNLASSLCWVGHVEEGIQVYRRLLAARPDFVEVGNNLGNALCDQGEIDEAIAVYERVIQAKPDFEAAQNNRLLAENYRAGATPAGLFSLHQAYAARLAPLSSSQPPFANVADADRMPSLGFVSADFRDHPVGHLTAPVFEALSALGCRRRCYYVGSVRDAVTERIGHAADIVWSAELSDEALASRIRADGIDVLVDLAGHSSGNRLPAFARKPAPVQATWLGYPGTTGLTAIDALIADRHAIPTDTETYYSEKIVRLPDAYFCFEPPAEAPGVEPPPMLKNGVPTFGSFNNAAKITPIVIAVWGRILREVADSRLVLKYYGFDDPARIRRFQELFAGHGVDPRRVRFIGGRVPQQDLLKLYHEIDVALDPFPYTGAFTTCTASWMGVPVVTWPSDTFASRQSFSILTAIGTPDTVADSADSYVAIARRLVTDGAELSRRRLELRRQMAASAFCNADRFSRQFLDAVRQLWRQWAESKAISGQ